MNAALETHGLGKRYGRTWAIRDCNVTVPAGRVAALVGPNGAGKTTLLQLAVGLSKPTEGSVQTMGLSASEQPTRALPRIGFLAQDRPLYKSFSVGELLKMGSKLNPNWDRSIAEGRLAKLNIPLNRKAGSLSGGQQSQVALSLILAKRPDLLLLDEPVAALDPLARREFLKTLMEAVVDQGLTVLLSTHIIGDLERVCDYLIVMSASHVQLAGGIDDILAGHKLLVGPRVDEQAVAAVHNLVEATHTSRQSTLLVRLNGHLFDSSWDVQEPTLEEIVLGYLGQSQSHQFADGGVEPRTGVTA